MPRSGLQMGRLCIQQYSSGQCGEERSYTRVWSKGSGDGAGCPLSTKCCLFHRADRKSCRLSIYCRNRAWLLSACRSLTECHLPAQGVFIGCISKTDEMSAAAHIEWLPGEPWMQGASLAVTLQLVTAFIPFPALKKICGNPHMLSVAELMD